MILDDETEEIKNESTRVWMSSVVVLVVAMLF